MYCCISENHPFLHDLKMSGELWERTDFDRLYQPENELWPLYWMKVVKVDGGIVVGLSVKCGPDVWWEPCSLLMPFPQDLVLRLGNMILILMAGSDEYA